MNRSPGGPVAPLRLLPRRRLLQGAAISTGGLAAGLLGARGVGAMPGSAPAWLKELAQGEELDLDTYEPRALTIDEAQTLRAVANRLIPTDELGPGAGEAGAFIFIDRQLAGPGAASLPLYQAGLAALNAAAGATGFTAADEAAQDALLTQLEAGEIADAPQGFFGLVLNQTRQGMFADPMYGGNLGFAGWDLIGYPGLKILWTEEEQAIDTVIEPLHRSVAEQGGTPYEPAP